MISKKTLGVFFGGRSISIVETENQAPSKIVAASHAVTALTDGGDKKNASDEIKLIALLQKTLREQKIKISEVSLSLPTKDIIFRSFIIPWMNPNEIKGVVDFESRKYIPFKLSELAYVYHPVTITDKNTKFIRILFTAIRIDILENYCGVLDQSGLQIVMIEPAAMSLIRVLVLKKLIPQGKRIAIVQADDKEGKIIIVDQGIPQFIRDFQLVQSSPAAPTLAEATVPNERLFNEIRISLDYYGRQNTQEKVDGIIVLSNSEENELTSSLGKELGISVTSVNAKTILSSPQSTNSIELVNAFGIGLRNSVSLSANFDIPRKVSKPVTGFTVETKLPMAILQASAKVALVCLGLIIGVYFVCDHPVRTYKKRIATLKEEQGSFQDLTKEEIDLKSKDVQSKIKGYKDVRVKSEVAFFLNVIPRMLPDGIWLKELTVNYSDIEETPTTEGTEVVEEDPNAKTYTISVAISGFSFVENINQQIRIVKNLVADLNAKKDFSSYFKTIDLATAQVQKLQDFTVTFFRIECE